jgi:hypothetical protein
MLYCGLNKHEIDGKNNVIDESAKKHHQTWKIKNCSIIMISTFNFQPFLINFFLIYSFYIKTRHRDAEM